MAKFQVNDVKYFDKLADNFNLFSFFAQLTPADKNPNSSVWRFLIGENEVKAEHFQNNWK